MINFSNTKSFLQSCFFSFSEFRKYYRYRKKREVANEDENLIPSKCEHIYDRRISIDCMRNHFTDEGYKILNSIISLQHQMLYYFCLRW